MDPSRQNGQLEPASDRFVKAQSILGILTLQTYAFPFSNAKDILPGSHLRLVSDAQLVPGHYTIEFTNFLRLRFRLGSLGWIQTQVWGSDSAKARLVKRLLAPQSIYPWNAQSWTLSHTVLVSLATIQASNDSSRNIKNHKLQQFKQTEHTMLTIQARTCWSKAYCPLGMHCEIAHILTGKRRERAKYQTDYRHEKFRSAAQKGKVDQSSYSFCL